MTKGFETGKPDQVNLFVSIGYVGKLSPSTNLNFKVNYKELIQTLTPKGIKMIPAKK